MINKNNGTLRKTGTPLLISATGTLKISLSSRSKSSEERGPAPRVWFGFRGTADDAGGGSDVPAPATLTVRTSVCEPRSQRVAGL
jgi:hypothetical protein